MSDDLSTDVLLDGHREVGPALDRGVIRHEEALSAMHDANAGDDTGAGRPVAVKAGRGKGRGFEKCSPRVDDGLDALAWEHLVTGTVALHRTRAPSSACRRQTSTKVIDQRHVGCTACSGLLGVGRKTARKTVHVAASCPGSTEVRFKHPTLSTHTSRMRRPTSRNPGASPTTSTARTTSTLRCC